MRGDHWGTATTSKITWGEGLWTATTSKVTREDRRGSPWTTATSKVTRRGSTWTIATSSRAGISERVLPQRRSCEGITVDPWKSPNWKTGDNRAIYYYLWLFRRFAMPLFLLGMPSRPVGSPLIPRVVMLCPCTWTQCKINDGSVEGFKCSPLCASSKWWRVLLWQNCMQWKSSRICSHVVAVAEKNHDLLPLLHTTNQEPCHFQHLSTALSSTK